jgi:hypothetical protein
MVFIRVCDFFSDSFDAELSNYRYVTLVTNRQKTVTVMESAHIFPQEKSEFLGVGG